MEEANVKFRQKRKDAKVPTVNADGFTLPDLGHYLNNSDKAEVILSP